MSALSGVITPETADISGSDGLPGGPAAGQVPRILAEIATKGTFIRGTLETQVDSERQRLGFVPTGDVDESGEVIMRLALP